MAPSRRSVRGPGRADAVGGDLGEPAIAKRAILERAWQALGGLDLLIVNHGIWPPDDTALAEMTRPAVGGHPARQPRQRRSSSAGPRFPHLLPDGGRVVLVASTAGQRGEAFHADYAATKGAIIAFTKSLAVELAPRITVNCVAPGVGGHGDGGNSRTRATAAHGRRMIERGIPLGRVATAADVGGSHRVPVLRSGAAHHGRSPEREWRVGVVRMSVRLIPIARLSTGRMSCASPAGSKRPGSRRGASAARCATLCWDWRITTSISPRRRHPDVGAADCSAAPCRSAWSTARWRCWTPESRRTKSRRSARTCRPTGVTPVEFGVSLTDDLARRDFTINAIAYHPLRHEWRDPFHGAADLERKLIRAVGDPELALPGGLPPHPPGPALQRPIRVPDSRADPRGGAGQRTGPGAALGRARPR